jgi:hypothetical protein
MRTHLFVLAAMATTLLHVQHTKAQSWSLSGNSNASSSSKLGTTNAIPLRLFTNNLPRIYISTSGNVGVGTTAPAQKLHVVGYGIFTPRVGINTTAPVYPLDILNPSLARGINVNNNFSGNQQRTAVHATSVNNPGWGYGVVGTGGSRGVIGTAVGGSYTGSATGVHGAAFGATTPTGAGSRYGVTGQASGGIFNAAGYFSGAVWASSYQTISDRKFKEGIAPLEHTLQQLMKLRPTAYQFKTGDYQSMHLPTGRQIGLIADELKQVFPELVQQAVHPAEYKEDSREEINPEIKYEGINYQGLIPILIAAVQEQQQHIYELKNELSDLKLLVLKLTAGQNISTFLNSAHLGEAIPNPVKSTASIQYSITEGSTRAQLLITDALGRQIKAIQLSTSGVINVDVTSLASGMYNYSLIVDNKTVVTRKMTVIK